MLLIVIVSLIVGASITFWYARDEPETPLGILSLLFMFASSIGWILALMAPFVVGAFYIQRLADQFPKPPDEPAS